MIIVNFKSNCDEHIQLAQRKELWQDNATTGGRSAAKKGDYQMPLYAYFHKQFVPLSEAKIGIMTHSLHYGTAAFEGIRATGTANISRSTFSVSKSTMSGCAKAVIF